MKATDVEGKRVVLTGNFAALKRAEAAAALTALGATVSDSVSKHTDLLFAGEKAGSKLARAEALGVPVHDEAALAKLLAGAARASAKKTAAKKTAAKETAAKKATKAAGSKSAPRAAKSASTPVPAFVGKVVALTGTFTTMTRAEAQKLLAEAGATVASGVTRATNLLIHGDNAGSKLDKASGLGVALMTEAEMVALLRAGGAGAEQLAGASEKLAAAAAAATAMTGVVAELRAFVQALRRRKDIVVERATLGRKASSASLARLRALQVPPEMVDLYAEVDGVHIEWRFAEPPGGGTMRIPAVSQWTRFTGDDSHYMNFGDEYEALLFDEITAEGNTWLVRGKGSTGGRLRFASAAEGDDAVTPAPSIAEYLRKAMQAGLAPYWPRCFQPRGRVSYAEQERIIERFRATPVAPTALAVGGRVQFETFAGGGRGQVLALREVPDSDATQFTGTKLVEVRTDEGSQAWIPQKQLKAWSTRDAYEELRATALAVTDARGLGELLDELARAIDPLLSYSVSELLGTLPGNARRAAGMLSARPLADAVAQVIALDQAVDRSRLDRKKQRKLARTGREFDPVELSRTDFHYAIGGLIEGLYGGLLVLAHHESARRGVPGEALLPADLVEQLAARDGGQALHERCRRGEPLAAPRWCDPNLETAAAMGLPPGAVLWSGGGF